MAAFDPRTDIPAITRAGWQCPECRTVYSPDVRQCDCARVAPSLAERAGRPRWVSPPPFGACNCNVTWGSILPPPPCPAHGFAEVLQVRC